MWRGVEFFSEPPPSQLALLALTGVVADLIILFNYYIKRGRTIHTKRRLGGARKQLGVVAHVASGAIEIAATIVRVAAARWPAVALPAAYAQAACGMVHALTCYPQMRSLFGATVLTWPGYAMVSTAKLCLALRLAASPLNLARSLQQICIHSVFAYVRVFYIIFWRTGLFSGSEYSAAGVLAMMLFIPALGPSANALAAVGLLLSVVFNWRGSERGLESEVFVERVRTLFHGTGLEGAPARCAQVILEAKPCLEASLTMKPSADRQQLWPFAHIPYPQFKAALAELFSESEEFGAKLAFAALDIEGRGVLTRGALRLLLFHWGRSQPYATELLRLADAVDQDEMGFEDFYAKLPMLWTAAAYILHRDLLQEHLLARRQQFLRAELARAPTKIYRTSTFTFRRQSSSADKTE